MPKVTGALIGLVGAAALLAGCSAATAEPAPTVTVTVPADTPSADAVEPLTAGTPSPSASQSVEEAFLEGVRDRLREDTTIGDATEEQLLAAGYQACEQMAAGVDVFEVQVVENEPYNETDHIYWDSSAIAGSAQYSLCPD